MFFAENSLNCQSETFLTFFPMRADALTQGPHKSVSVRGLCEELGYARLQASMNVDI